MDPEELRRRVCALLDSETTLVLSTADEHGSAYAAPLFFVRAQGLELFWMSSASSAHSRNIERSGQAAAAAFVPTTDWRDIRGVQVRGRCGLASEAERASILPAYLEKFGLGEEWKPLIERTRMYVLRPDSLRYLDNSVSFGFSQEIEMIEPAPRDSASND